MTLQQQINKCRETIDLSVEHMVNTQTMPDYLLSYAYKAGVELTRLLAIKAKRNTLYGQTYKA